MNGIKPDKNAYTLKVDIPGHFTMSRSIVLSVEVRRELVGIRIKYILSTVKAGDTNKHNVIDILDAFYLQTNWGTSQLGLK